MKIKLKCKICNKLTETEIESYEYKLEMENNYICPWCKFKNEMEEQKKAEKCKK